MQAAVQAGQRQRYVADVVERQAEFDRCRLAGGDGERQGRRLQRQIEHTDLIQVEIAGLDCAVDQAGGLDLDLERGLDVADGAGIFLLFARRQVADGLIAGRGGDGRVRGSDLHGQIIINERVHLYRL